MDIIWSHLRTDLPRLAEIALSLQTIPHSNAAEERVFSMIGKNKTKFRANLDLARSLNSIMLIKLNNPEALTPCYTWKPTDDLLRKCKSACMEYNRAHKNADE